MVDAIRVLSIWRIVFLGGGRASVPRAITAGGLLYARETKALVGFADLLLCKGKEQAVACLARGTLALPLTDGAMNCRLEECEIVGSF